MANEEEPVLALLSLAFGLVNTGGAAGLRETPPETGLGGGAGAVVGAGAGTGTGVVVSAGGDF